MCKEHDEIKINVQLNSSYLDIIVRIDNRIWRWKITIFPLQYFPFATAQHKQFKTHSKKIHANTGINENQKQIKLDETYTHTHTQKME